MTGIVGSWFAWFVFLLASILEVGGDAVIRKGVRGDNRWFVPCGCLLLAAYGLVVNLVYWDFSKLLGVYIAVFAVVTILVSRFILGEEVPASTWAGLGLIVLGALVIQAGAR